MKLLWVDIETTGLNEARDTIVELACVITDRELRRIASYHAVIRTELKDWAGANEVVLDMHTRNGLLVESIFHGKHHGVVHDELKSFLPEEKYLIAGASVHFDKKFITCKFAINDKLHYRCLDISSWKWLRRVQAGQDPDASTSTRSTHRALDDIEHTLLEAEAILAGAWPVDSRSLSA